MIGRIIRWLYRDSDTGRFMSKGEFDRRDPKMTQRERVTNDELPAVIDEMKANPDA